MTSTGPPTLRPRLAPAVPVGDVARSASGGSYRELGLLAEGGMALVQSAVREGDGAAVVIKRVRPPLCFDASYLRLFADEAAVHGALDGCAHVVRLLDRGEDEQGPYLVFEHVDGTDLGVLLDKAVCSSQPLDVEFVLAIARALLTALAFVHEAKKDGTSLDVVHRDVSPGNVLLGEDGCVKLADFGVAAFSLKSEVTIAGELKGKFAYMAPEQTRGEKVCARADLFATGIVLWECLQNRRLFDAPTDADVVQQVRERPAPALDAARVGADLAALVASLLEKNPANRPATARQAKERIDEILLNRGLDDGLSRIVARAVRQAPRRTLQPSAPDVRRRTQRVRGPALPTVRKRPQSSVVVVAVLLLAALAVGVGWWRAKAPELLVETLPPEEPLPAKVAALPLEVQIEAAVPVAAVPVAAVPAGPLLVSHPLAHTPAAVRRVRDRTVVVPPPLAVADGFGRLSLNAEPWARVLVDGVVVDEETPLVGFSLPAGRHTVVLENPVSQLRQSFVVEIVKDGHERRFVDLGH